MTTLDDRPTLVEQYSRAIGSSHLEVSARTRGDVDVLIAAGWVTNHLGTMLYRLAAEFDAAKGEQTRARQHIVTLTSKADVDEQRVRKLMKGSLEQQEEAKKLSGELEQLRDEIARELVSERAFLMMKLKTLATTKEALGQWAIVKATRRRFMHPDDAVMKLAGRALDVFLDGLCSKCQGRGFNGGFGGPQILCRACAGSGKRSARAFGNPDWDDFGHHLLSEMERMLDGVDRTMRGYLFSTQGETTV